MLRTIALVALFLPIWCVLPANAQTVVPLCVTGKPCPPYDNRPPATGAAAKRAYLKAIAREIEDKQVVDERNGRFTVVTPPQWYADWCSVETYEYPSKRRLYYHVKLDEKSCLAERPRIEAVGVFQPFYAYGDQRIICDSPQTHRCAAAAETLKALAKRELADDSSVIFGDVSETRSASRERLAGYFQGDIGRGGGVVHVEESYYPSFFAREPCARIAPGGMACRMSEGRTVIYVDGPPPIP